MFKSLIKLCKFVWFLSLAAAGTGQSLAAPPENPPEDFVKSSIVVTDPGETVYSSAGHAFFRMQCPSNGMDFCFSYESEDVGSRVFTFLCGNLRMGMAVERTDRFIEQYRREGRGVWEYPLNLPIEVKQNLWRVLDNHVDEGMELPYDYLERGCAISVLHILEEAVGKRRLQYGAWPPQFDMTRRELLTAELDHAPWSRLAINILTNGSANDEVPYKEKAITPKMLIEVLHVANLNGKPVIAAEPKELAASNIPLRAGWCTPTFVAIAILLLTVVCAMTGHRWMLYALLAIQTGLGLFNVYLVFFSSLCATEWSWLLIPFNPLPAIFWKWRRIWEIPAACIIAIWVLAMSVSLNSLTDPALILLALSTAFAFAGDWLAVPIREKIAQRHGQDSLLSRLSFPGRH